MPGPSPSVPPEEVRLDVYLDVACLFPTRSRAAAACKGGKVDLNGTSASAHKMVRPGDQLKITFEGGRRRTFRVVAVAEHHMKKSDARALYEETTPPPSAAELEARRLESLLGAQRDLGGRPSGKDRRDRDRYLRDRR